MNRKLISFACLVISLFLIPCDLAAQTGPTLLTPPVAIGTTTPEASSLLEVMGGSQLFAPASSSGIVYHYTHLATYTAPSVTGTIEVILTGALDSTTLNEVNMTIEGYSWPNAPWQIRIGGLPGYTACPTGGNYQSNEWCGAGVSISGGFPYTYVRLGYDTVINRFVVLLGTTSSTWYEPTIEVTDATVNNVGPVYSGVGKGWAIATLSSESSVQFVKTITSAASEVIVGPTVGSSNVPNSADPTVAFEVQGGAELAVPIPSNGVTYHYSHLTSYTIPGVTGTMEVVLPAAIAPNKVSELNITIKGYAWPWGPWTIQVGGFAGFNQCTTSSGYQTYAWCGAGASITGAFPYSYVRLAYDSSITRFVVLLGATNTYWDDPTVEVTDVLSNNENSAPIGLGTGWSIRTLTSEAGIQYVNTVHNAANRLAIGAISGEGPTSSGDGSDSSVSFEVFGGASLAVPVRTSVAGAVPAAASGPINHYRDLVGFYTGGLTGEYEIPIPNSATDSSSVTMTISSPNWQVTVGGMENFGNVQGWSYGTVVASGNPPLVRLAFDTKLNDYVVLLGTTTSTWPGQTIEVTDYTEGAVPAPPGSKGTGWAVALLTSESSLSKIATPSSVTFTGVTVAASNCGSLTKSAGCLVVNITGVPHYVPFW